MKIYVITRGDYSAYHICGVATDKDKANKIAEMCSGWDEASVEEYDTEAFDPLLQGKKIYKVELCGENAFVYECEPEDFSITDFNVVKNYYKLKGAYFVYVLADDTEHAKKIGLDLIYQHKYKHEVIANGEQQAEGK